jgi:hypothetical protein
MALAGLTGISDISRTMFQRVVVPAHRPQHTDLAIRIRENRKMSRRSYHGDSLGASMGHRHSRPT